MLISISEQDPRPIYTQIVADVKRQIREGTLKPGEELPSVRELADSLRVNLHTVHHAYRILREQGVIYLRLGQRAKVAPIRQAPSKEQIEAALAPRVSELITEAFHLGLSPEDLRKLVDEMLEKKDQGDDR